MSEHYSLGAGRDTAVILQEIEANQRAYEDAEASWKRMLPFWLIRRQYALCKANEPLFERIGITQPPFMFETARGLSWSITRKLIGV